MKNSRKSRLDDWTIRQMTWQIGKTTDQVDKMTWQIIGKTTEWVDNKDDIEN